jgi:hypothetical protein
MARPSAYRSLFAEQALKLCKLGATDKELADFFSVTEKTINTWKINFPEFLQSLKRGKQESDERVEQSLYRRALGYSHDAVKIFHDAAGTTAVPYVEHYPPDTTACIFWLKNRKPGEWRDKIDVDTGLSRDRVTRLLELVEGRLNELEPTSATTAEGPGLVSPTH